MADKPFDPTLKDLIEDNHTDWARRFNPRPVIAAELVDAESSTVTAAADKVLRVTDEAGMRLLLFEPLSYHDNDAPRRVHLYATVQHGRHQLPVRAILLLLRREANASAITGTYEVFEPGETEPYERFRYQVVRLWEQPVAPLLNGELGLLPLAPLTDEAAGSLESVVRRVNERIRAEALPEEAGKLLTATFVLLGLRYAPELTAELYREVSQMEESTTYQLIVSRGKLQNARKTLVRLGRLKCGEPDAAQLAFVESIDDLQRLESLTDRVLSVSTWSDLLAAP